LSIFVLIKHSFNDRFKIPSLFTNFFDQAHFRKVPEDESDEYDRVNINEEYYYYCSGRYTTVSDKKKRGKDTKFRAEKGLRE
jgi:hypothetical protein